MSTFSNNESNASELLQELRHDSNLSELKQNQEEEIFPITDDIPHLLTENLNSDNRVVKLIKNDDNIEINVIRGFYFQLLKLCFELEDQQNSKNYLSIAKNIIFIPSFLQNQQLRTHLKHLDQFFSIMQETEDLTFEDILSEYHQIDDALVTVLSLMLVKDKDSHQSQNQIQNILNQLCQYFQITLLPEDPFYQFEESNVYLFVENQHAMYLVYDDTYNESENISESNISNSQQTPSESKLSKLSEKEEGRQPSQHVESKEYAQRDRQGSFKLKNQSKQNQIAYGQRQGSFKLKNQSKQNQIAYALQNIRPSSHKSNKSNGSNKSNPPFQAQFEAERFQSKNWYEADKAEKGNTPIKLQNPFNSYQGEFNKQVYNASMSSDNFKKGITKTSNLYQISSPQIQKRVNLPASDKVSSHYFSPNQISKPTSDVMTQSHYVNNSLSHYYDGLYGDVQGSANNLNASKNDTIMNLFGDMLKSGKYEGSYTEQNRPTKKHLQSTQQILQAHQDLQKQDSDIYPKFLKNINKMDTVDMIDRAKSVHSINQHNSSDMHSNSIVNSKTLQYSIAEKNKPSISSENSEKRNYSTLIQGKIDSYLGMDAVLEKKISEHKQIQKEVVNFDEDDSIFYKPKKSMLKAISQVTASKETISGNFKTSQKVDDDDSRGSVYRQFTDTRILKLLKEPHRTKVQILRNRFKGQHFNT